jgi:hypothetical protein
MTTIADGLEMSDDGGALEDDLRRNLTTSLTPRRRVLVFAAGVIVSIQIVSRLG